MGMCNEFSTVFTKFFEDGAGAANKIPSSQTTSPETQSLNAIQQRLDYDLVIVGVG